MYYLIFTYRYLFLSWRLALSKCAMYWHEWVYDLATFVHFLFFAKLPRASRASSENPVDNFIFSWRHGRVCIASVAVLFVAASSIRGLTWRGSGRAFSRHFTFHFIYFFLTCAAAAGVPIPASSSEWDKSCSFRSLISDALCNWLLRISF